MVDLAKWDLKPAVEIGCVRRNYFTEGVAPWRILRGNLICMALGAYKYQLVSPISKREFVVLLTGAPDAPKLTTFRAGPWKDWWERDMQELAALVMAAGQALSCILVWYEYNDELNAIEIPIDNIPLDVLEARWAWANDQRTAEAPPRINKSFPRAKACWYCPHKRRCDSLDELFGQTEDWPKGYKAGPK